MGNAAWPCQKPPWGRLTAVNTATGDFAWQIPLGITEGLPAGKQNTGRPALAGPIVTASGLLFVASTDDNYFRAFEAKTGKQLWATKLDAQREREPDDVSGAQREAVCGDRRDRYAGCIRLAIDSCHNLGRQSMRIRYILLTAITIPIAFAQSQADRDWPMFNRDLAGTRYSPLKQIDTANVAKLTKAWQYRFNREGKTITRPEPQRAVPGDHAHCGERHHVHARRAIA